MAGQGSGALSSEPHTYSHALELLTQLQPNHAVTHGLFSASARISASTTTSPPSAPSLAALNALAIPEMHAWLRRAGIDAATTLAAPGAPRFVHVAGTKGKGSVTALTACVLAQYPSVAGRIGAYLSPHMVSVRERIQLDGRPISRELFARYFFEVWDRLAAAAAEAEQSSGSDLLGRQTMPFYFRFLTILALHVFLREGVRSAVVECGIGGEYDSTNVLPAPAVTAAVITQLGIDHVAMLGGTLEEIAWHKAGVLKSGVTGFTRQLPIPDGKGVMEILRSRAREKGATLVEVPDEAVEAWEGVKDANLQGPFQKYNMALSAAAARQHLLSLGCSFDPDFARDGYLLSAMPREFEVGLASASLRGRCETFTLRGVEWFVDGAHTADSLAGVGQWFAQRSKQSKDALRVLIFNQQDRDRKVTQLLEALFSGVTGETGQTTTGFWDFVLFPRNDLRPLSSPSEPSRDLTVQNEAMSFAREKIPGIPGEAVDNIKVVFKAVDDMAQRAVSEARPCHVLVTGSFQTVAAVLKALELEGAI